MLVFLQIDAVPWEMLGDVPEAGLQSVLDFEMATDAEGGIPEKLVLADHSSLTRLKRGDRGYSQRRSSCEIPQSFLSITTNRKRVIPTNHCQITTWQFGMPLA